MIKTWEFKLTPTQFNFFVVVWTISMSFLSVTSIMAMNHVITRAIVFPEYIRFDFASARQVGILILSVVSPLTLILFYLRIFFSRISIRLLRALFIAVAIIWVPVMFSVVVAQGDFSMALIPLIIFVSHFIVLIKLERFYERLERKHRRTMPNLHQTASE